jgi:hypothetical protein
VSSPFIFIATNRLKPGKLDRERARVPGLVEFIEANGMLREQAGSGVEISVNGEHLGGFTRSGAQA